MTRPRGPTHHAVEPAIRRATAVATRILLRIAGPVYFSQVAYLVTLFGVGFGMLVFGERHPGSAWLALLMIFAGLALVNRRPT